MNLLLVLPLIIPATAAALCLAAGRRLRLQRRISAAAAALHLAAGIALFAAVRGGGILVAQVGNWPAPFGITLVSDLFSAIMVVLTGLMGLSVLV